MFMMLGSGIYLGMAHDTFRRLERYWNKLVVASFFIEILYWLLQGLVIFYFLFISNHGELRVYIFLLILCGFTMYQALFKPIYHHVLEWGIAAALVMLRAVHRLYTIFIFYPIKGLGVLLLKMVEVCFATLVWLLLLIGKVVWYPIQLMGRLMWQITPKFLKNYLSPLRGFYSKIKNILLQWWNKIRQKGR